MHVVVTGEDAEAKASGCFTECEWIGARGCRRDGHVVMCRGPKNIKKGDLLGTAVGVLLTNAIDNDGFITKVGASKLVECLILLRTAYFEYPHLIVRHGDRDP